MGDFVKESFLKDKRIEVIKNGVDLKVFRPSSKFQVASSKFRIIAVSSVWNPDKGELDVYRLRKMLSKEEYEIIMVGLSADQAQNLPAGIRGIQRTQNVQELVRLYSESDVLINPTYADTFPTVNLEALACGTPVITYRTGGSPEANLNPRPLRTFITFSLSDTEKLTCALCAPSRRVVSRTESFLFISHKTLHT